MREIIFKAKTKCIVREYNNGIDDGKWVKGYLRHDCGMWLIYQFELDRADQVAYEIDPDTICQYTGLTDTDGNKIWENDIMIFRHEKYEVNDENFLGYTKYYSRNYVIEFTNTFSTYGLRFRNKSIHFPCKQATISMHNCVVIGNIFDNPELLEGEI